MILSYLYGKLVKKLHGTCVINSKIQKGAYIGESCNIHNSEIGRYSYCCHNCQIVNTKIGSFCSISDNVYIGGAEHPIEWVSTSPVFQNVRHSGPTRRFAKFNLPEYKLTIIGNDVWIGHGATIKQGVKIGHGAVIGSNSVITKDVPPYAIVAGVPSKVIRYRFDEQTIGSLLKIKWWDLPEHDIRRIAPLIKNPQEFIESCM